MEPGHTLGRKVRYSMTDHGLDEEQQRAVTAPPGPVCVLAGAGTGKTRTITHRMAHLITSGQFAADHILAVTFTSRAAGEMRTRLRSMGIGSVQARTFHSAALRQLQYFWPRSVGGEPWPVLDNKMRLVSAVCRRLNLGTDIAVLRDVAAEIEWAKASLIAPEKYAEAVAEYRRDTPVQPAEMVRAYQLYEHLKSEAQRLDFDDLLLHVCAVLESDEDAARTFRAQYRAFVVDEFQDVTPLQHRMLDAWLGGRDDVTVVGDANQTIYSFAGASPRYLLEFNQRYPHATVVRLERDYRSTPQVVSVANKVMGAARGRNARLKLTLRAALADGPEAQFHEYPDEQTEATAIAGVIAGLIRSGVPIAEIAILYRINAQSEIYEKALSDAGIPYVLKGGQRFFARPEIRQAISAISRVAAAGESDVAPEHAGSLQESSDGDRSRPELVPAVRRVLEAIGFAAVPPASGAQRDRWDALAALLALAEDLAADQPDAGMADFAAELRRRGDDQHAPTLAGVTLASLHAAKGLEWDAVFLVGVTDGMVPIQHAETEEEIEEERRLLYVGVTRARTRLSVSWALARQATGRRHRERSRFLTGIAPEVSQPAGSRRPQRSRGSGGCRHCGAPLASPAEVKAALCERCQESIDPELFEALREWRLGRAKEASLPAYVVFTDATLRAIAADCPASSAELLRISGVGAAKLERYGEEVLEIVGAHAGS